MDPCESKEGGLCCCIEGSTDHAQREALMIGFLLLQFIQVAHELQHSNHGGLVGEFALAARSSPQY